MFDKDYTPYVLEVNADPFLLTGTRATGKAIPAMVKDMMNLVIYLQDKQDSIWRTMKD